MDKIFRSEHRSEGYIEPQRTLYKFICDKLSNLPDEQQEYPYIIDHSTGQTIYLKQIIPVSRKVSSALNKLGFRKRDGVCLITENRCHIGFAMMACFASGGVLSTLVPYSPEGDLETLLLTVKPKVIYVCKDSEEKVHNIMNRNVLANALVYSFDESDYFPHFDVLMDDNGECFPEDTEIDFKKDPILYLPSSGTTGLPKLIQHTNYTTMVFIENFHKPSAVASTGKLLVLNCCYHMSGIFLIIAITGDMTLVILSDPPLTDEKILSCIEKQKIVVLSLFPFQISNLANYSQRDKYDTSSLVLLFTGGSKLFLGVRKKFLESYKSVVTITEGYGATETLLFLESDFRRNKKGDEGSVGVLHPFAEVKIVDCETGELLGPNQRGEICVRAPCIMIGYKDEPEKTAQVIDKDGFYHMGDVGWIDEDGHIFVDDRINNYIKFQCRETSILTVYCSDIERVLLRHPDVHEVAVASIHHQEYQEVPRAYVVPVKGCHSKQNDILEYANALLDDSQQIRGGLYFVERIPRNANGKILRHLLKTL